MDVTLRPFRADDVDRFDAEFTTSDGVGPHQWFGFRNRGLAHQEFADSGYLTGESGQLVVEVDGDWAGRVAWWKRTWGPAESWCWQFGILLRTAMRDRGVGTAAQRYSPTSVPSQKLVA